MGFTVCMSSSTFTSASAFALDCCNRDTEPSSVFIQLNKAAPAPLINTMATTASSKLKPRWPVIASTTGTHLARGRNEIEFFHYVIRCDQGYFAAPANAVEQKNDRLLHTQLPTLGHINRISCTNTRR